MPFIEDDIEDAPTRHRPHPHEHASVSAKIEKLEEVLEMQERPKDADVISDSSYEEDKPEQIKSQVTTEGEKKVKLD